MEKINAIAELKASILVLEIKQANEARQLKEQFDITREHLKPANLVKNTFNELVAAPDFKDNLLNTAIGLVTGYFSKKVAFGSTHNPIKQLFGTILQMGVTGIVTKNGAVIQTVVGQLINKLFTKKPKATVDEIDY